MPWSVSFEPRAFKELEKLDRIPQARISAFLQDKVSGSNDPRRLAKRLTGGTADLWRYRVGDYRIICHLDDASSRVVILRIAHRKEAYR